MTTEKTTEKTEQAKSEAPKTNWVATEKEQAKAEKAVAQAKPTKKQVAEAGKKTKQPKPKVGEGLCPCGCGEKPRKGVFVAGHDGRLSGWLRAIDRGDKKPGDFPPHVADAHRKWTKAGKPGGKHPHVRQLFAKA